MTDWLNPALVMILGALLLPLFRGRAQQIWRLALPALVFLLIIRLVPGEYGALQFLDFNLLTGRVDALSLVFAHVFGLIGLIAAIYAWHVRDTIQHAAAYLYAGGALGVVFAGDLLTLYVFWELMAFASVWLIWRRKNEVSMAAGWRYLLVHAAGGMILLAGIGLHYLDTGSIAFTALDNNGLAFYLILVGFLVNAAVPPLHAWLADAYPEATITGAIFLSALTTKTAVYTLMRGFPGTELLIWMGAIMTLYGVIYAILANDIRRLLAYHIISQVGFMVCGIGMGTVMALNGSASHAYTHILYKALLFMGAGAIIHMTGKSKLTDLGGLYRHMPVTFVLFMIGALSISGFPLFSGFVSKTMILEAAALDGRGLIWLMLSLAAVGTFLSIALKLAWFAFFGRDSGLRPREAPANMLLAMAIAAFFCAFIGLNPGWLYAMLPAEVNYNAYTPGHLLWELQLLLFAGLSFFLLLKVVGPKDKITLDLDWLYRVGAPALLGKLAYPIQRIDAGVRQLAMRALDSLLGHVRHHYGKDGTLASTWPSGSMVLWVGLMLAVLLLTSLF